MTKNRRQITFIKGNVGPMRVQQKKKKKPTPVGRAIRALGGLGGRALGGYFGAPELGSAAGSQLAALASRWMGFGKYAVSRNSILKSDASTTIPSMHKTNQSITVRHKEYIGPIVGSQDFTVQYELPLNPVLLGTFPWLSGIAERYQEYTFKGVVFHYIPSSGAAVSSTNAALGTVMMQTTYRASDSQPFGKVEMLNEYCASESVPSETFIHPIECDPRENPFNVQYVRTQPPPSNEPLMSYDLGKTFVATQGQQVNGFTLGDLWVTYEVELRKPIVRSDTTEQPYYLGRYLPGADIDHVFAAKVSNVGVLNVHAENDQIQILDDNHFTYLIMIDFATGNFSSFSAGASPEPAVANGHLVHAIDGTDTCNFSRVVSGSSQSVAYFAVQRHDLNRTITIDFTHAFAMTGAFNDAVYLQVFPLQAVLP